MPSKIPGEETVRFAGVACDVLCVSGGPAAPGDPSRLEKLRAVRASLGSHATLGVDSGSSSALAAFRRVAGAFLVELATAGADDLTMLEAMLRELADAHRRRGSGGTPSSKRWLVAFGPVPKEEGRCLR